MLGNFPIFSNSVNFLESIHLWWSSNWPSTIKFLCFDNLYNCWVVYSFDALSSMSSRVYLITSDIWSCSVTPTIDLRVFISICRNIFLILVLCTVVVSCLSPLFLFYRSIFLFPFVLAIKYAYQRYIRFQHFLLPFCSLSLRLFLCQLYDIVSQIKFGLDCLIPRILSMCSSSN